MSAPPKHAIRPATLEAIVEAAIHLLNANAGATMSEIAAQAGVGRATLHRHFQTRKDLIRAIGIRCIEEMNASVQIGQDAGKPAVDRLRSMFRAVIPLGDRYSFLSLESADDDSVRQGYKVQLRWVEALVEDLKKQREIDPDVPTRWVVAQIDQLVWTAWNGTSEGYLTPDEASELAVRTLIHGLHRRAQPHYSS
ncbi:MAG: TetR/AcrR family transcriptional regulator [Proteobacteria bacterium]|nr:TetR/AcrR family transcriptional regulator [Pseudomonadota bacterium]